MPKLKKPEDEEIKEEKEEESSETIETEDGGVEVSIEEAPEKREEEEKKEEKEEKKEKKFKPDESWKNKVYAQDRIVSRLQKEIESLKSRLSETPSSIQKEQKEQEIVLDEIDKLAQTDWKAAVRKLAHVEARSILEVERKEIEELKTREEVSQIMEKNSESVLQKHPELNEVDSEKAQIFQDVLSKNPRWRTLADGPLLTMYEMENELRKRGYDVEGVIEKKVEAEKERLIKARASALPSSRSQASNKIVLTKEQREFCDQNGISYEDYARTLTRTQNQGGVEV